MPPRIQSMVQGSRAVRPSPCPHNPDDAVQPWCICFQHQRRHSESGLCSSCLRGADGHPPGIEKPTGWRSDFGPCISRLMPKSNALSWRVYRAGPLDASSNPSYACHRLWTASNPIRCCQGECRSRRRHSDARADGPRCGRPAPDTATTAVLAQGDNQAPLVGVFGAWSRCTACGRGPVLETDGDESVECPP